MDIQNFINWSLAANSGMTVYKQGGKKNKHDSLNYASIGIIYLSILTQDFVHNGLKQAKKVGVYEPLIEKVTKQASNDNHYSLTVFYLRGCVRLGGDVEQIEDKLRLLLQLEQTGGQLVLQRTTRQKLLQKEKRQNVSTRANILLVSVIFPIYIIILQIGKFCS